MSTLALILFFTFLGSVVSLAGGVVLLYKENLAHKISHFLTAFAAGVLLGVAFFDLLPEAFDEKGHTDVLLWTLVGILLFFLLERFIHWYHHHDRINDEHIKGKSVVSLLVVGDSIHNFIDGVTIALTFLVSIPLGIVTSLAVIAHEIPQEIGDFGIMLHKGVPKQRVLAINVISALTAMIGALLAFSASQWIKEYIPLFLSLAAGFFIYIAASDLIPEIHNEERKVVAFLETILLLVGVFTVWVMISALEH